MSNSKGQDNTVGTHNADRIESYSWFTTYYYYYYKIYLLNLFSALQRQ